MKKIIGYIPWYGVLIIGVSLVKKERQMENNIQEKFMGYPSIDHIGQKKFNTPITDTEYQINTDDNMDTLQAKEKIFIKKLKNEGHTCIWIMESYPIQTAWCEQTPCVNSIEDNRKSSQNHVFYIEEKYDGSRMGFRLENNKLVYYNKNHPISATSSSFTKTMVMLDPLADKINPDYIYYGEAISRVKHNINIYSRTPRYFFILFDVYDTQNKSYLLPLDKKAEADRLGLECAALLYANTDLIVSYQKRSADTGPETVVYSQKTVEPVDICKDLLNKMVSGAITSSLGGVPEGMVVKWYNYYKREKGEFVNRRFKYVMDSFKERRKIKQPKMTRTVTEFLECVGLQFNVEARFRKAFQHLSESSQLTSDNDQNLQLLIAESNADLIKEYGTELKSYIWSEIMTDVKKYARSDLATWYKQNVGDIDTKQNNYVATIVPVEKSSDTIYIESISQKYNTDERFANIFGSIKDSLGSVLHKNYMNLINALDNDIDQKRQEIENIVLPHYLPVIFAASNKDLEMWWTKKISNNLI